METGSTTVHTVLRCFTPAPVRTVAGYKKIEPAGDRRDVKRQESRGSGHEQRERTACRGGNILISSWAVHNIYASAALAARDGKKMNFMTHSNVFIQVRSNC